MRENGKQRDVRFDVIKAVAIILVFLGHIMQCGFDSYTDNPAFQIIWALQIPLFMFVSGYFSTNEKQLSAREGLFRIGKRAVSYVLPFVSYFYVIKVLVIGVHGRNIVTATKSLLYHTESSLWFLWAVFVLSVIFTIGDVVSGKVKHPVGRFVTLGGAVLAALLPWVLVCFKVSTTLLGCKYVLYYTLFFGAGFLLHKYKATVSVLLRKQWLADGVFAACLVVFAWIVLNVQVYSAEDGILNTICRVIAGFTGIAVVGLLARGFQYCPDSKLHNTIIKIGKNTLEIYAMHSVALLALTKMNVDIFTTAGYIKLAVDALVVAFITWGLISILKATKLTNFLFFGRSRKLK